MPRPNVAMPGLKHWLTPHGVPLPGVPNFNFTILLSLAGKFSPCYMFGCVDVSSLDGYVYRCVQI